MSEVDEDDNMVKASKAIIDLLRSFAFSELEKVVILETTKTIINNSHIIDVILGNNLAGVKSHPGVG